MTPETKPVSSKADDAQLQDDASRSAQVAVKHQRTVTLIYVPLNLGGPHRGVSMGPDAMRVAEVAAQIEKLGLRVAKEVDVRIPSTVCFLDKGEHARCVPEIAEVNREVAELVEDALTQGHIPITIGGDHSLAIGSIAGVSNYYRKKGKTFGLVWFDAHGDINTPDTSHSGNVHGMPLAVSLGVGDNRLTDLLGYSPKVVGTRTALLGIRDLDEAERDIINKSGISAFTIRDIDHLGLGRVTELALGAVGSDVSGIHLSFDIDVLDPDLAPGVSTPARGGLNYREAHLALTLLAESQLVGSIDIVELNPAFDNKNSTAELAVELILSALGQRIL